MAAVLTCLRCRHVTHRADVRVQDKSLSMESRMLTTAMLTQLNDLRRKQKCLFFIATNRLRSFDAAVIRPGRFDAIVFVG